MCFFLVNFHKTISVWQTYMKHLVYTLQFFLKTLYIDYFYTGESKIRARSLVILQPHGGNFCKKDFVFKQFGEMNIPLSLHA